MELAKKELIARAEAPALPLDYTDKELLEVLRNSVAQNSTDAEFKFFIEFCKSTRLNPLRREVWFIKVQGRLQMMTGINGFFAIANSHPEYDGLEPETSYDEHGNPVMSIAKAWRKDRRFPSIGKAIMKESRGSSPVWGQQPTVMLEKVAKARALREAFPQELSGLYTDEELEAEDSPLQLVDTRPAHVRIAEVVQQEQQDKRAALLEEDPFSHRIVGVPNSKGEYPKNAGKLISDVAPDELKRALRDPRVRAHLTDKDLANIDEAVGLYNAQKHAAPQEQQQLALAQDDIPEEYAR